MKTYYLRRHEDVSGNSGCGRVAQVAEFDDGAAVLHWNRGANTSGVSSTGATSVATAGEGWELSAWHEASNRAAAAAVRARDNQILRKLF